MSDLTTANTILDQLGGRRFQVMTGAKHFVGTDNSLTFRLPGTRNFVRDKINAVRVTLNDLDLYDVDYMRVYGTKCRTVNRSAGIYADMLRDNFTRITGLDTSFGRVVA